MSAKSPHPMFGHDCPRCGQGKTTFDILSQSPYYDGSVFYETFARCRHCNKCSIALFSPKMSNSTDIENLSGEYINSHYAFCEWVSVVPVTKPTPKFVPEPIARIFQEAATCTAIGNWDAGGTMFRKTLDASTRSITPRPDSEELVKAPNWKTYKDLKLRLDWLFEKQILSAALKDLSSCIHEDGNDAAHDLVGIDKAEASDLSEFTEMILQALYTVPGQIEENRRRRDERRGTSETASA